jgi:hypothetical protein
MISTRRLCCRHTAVSLSATGLAGACNFAFHSSPNPPIKSTYRRWLGVSCSPKNDAIYSWRTTIVSRSCFGLGDAWHERPTFSQSP